MSRSTRRRPPFWSVLLNACWPSMALWLALLATQGISLGYL